MMRSIINSKLVNKAIKKFGLELAYTRGDGYFYFLDLSTGNQVGESVYVNYLNRLTLEEWVNEAILARISACHVNYNPEGSYEADFEERFLATFDR